MPFKNLEKISSEELIPGFHGKFIHTDRVTFVNWTIKAGSILPVHNHEHEQITQMIEGEMEFTLDGETRIIKSGDIAVVPSHVVHSGRAITDCYLIDVFQPAREDYQ